MKVKKNYGRLFRCSNMEVLLCAQEVEGRGREGRLKWRKGGGGRERGGNGKFGLLGFALGGFLFSGLGGFVV